MKGEKNAIRNEKNESCTAFEFQIDITSKKSIDELIEISIRKFEKIDAVVNNAYPRNKNYGRARRPR